MIRIREIDHLTQVPSRRLSTDNAILGCFFPVFCLS